MASEGGGGEGGAFFGGRSGERIALAFMFLVSLENAQCPLDPRSVTRKVDGMANKKFFRLVNVHSSICSHQVNKEGTLFVLS
jgi:hypothetical protein